MSCVLSAARAPYAKLVFGVWLYLGFGAVSCPGLALSNAKVCPCAAHVGFGAFLWTRVLTGFSEYLLNEDWTCKLLCVSLSEWVCVCGQLWRAFCPYPLEKTDWWWCLGHRWCPVIDRNKLSVVFSSVFSFFCFCLRSNGMVTFCIIYLRSPELVHCCCLKFSWGKLDFSPWELCFLVLCLGSVVACLPNCYWEHLAVVPWAKEKEM